MKFNAWMVIAAIALLIAGTAMAANGRGNGTGERSIASFDGSDDGFKTEDSMKAQKIKVSIEDDGTQVHITGLGEEQRFDVNGFDLNEVISKIMERTGLTESQIRERMQMNSKEKENDDEKEGMMKETRKKMRKTMDIMINGKERHLNGFVMDVFKNKFRFEEDTNQGSVIDQNFDLNDFKKGIVVKVSDGNKLVEITIKKGNGQTITLDQNQISALANGNIEFDGNAMYIAKFNNGKHAFKLLPKQANEIAKRHANFFAIKLLELNVDDQGNSVYVAKGMNVGKLFGIIPIQFDSETHINAQTGVVLKSNKPWWALLVTNNS